MRICACNRVRSCVDVETTEPALRERQSSSLLSESSKVGDHWRALFLNDAVCWNKSMVLSRRGHGTITEGAVGRRREKTGRSMETRGTWSSAAIRRRFVAQRINSSSSSSKGPLCQQLGDGEGSVVDCWGAWFSRDKHLAGGDMCLAHHFEFCRRRPNEFKECNLCCC